MQIHVAGTGLRGSGYPNATGTLKILRHNLGVSVVDWGRWLPEGTMLWRKAGSPGKAILALAGISWLNLREAIRIRPLARSTDALVYAPYPAIFLLWWLSWLPRSARPRVIADAYVSLWDAAFRDRGIARESGLISCLFRRFEGRALRAADGVNVDTIANRDWFIDVFGLESSRVKAIPLALDVLEQCSGGSSSPCSNTGSELKVLFIGTLVPLQGVGVIAEAAQILLRKGVGVDFTFVGDGQDSAALESLLTSQHGVRVKWIRGWNAPAELAARLQEADVCLGVFGGDGKASRVLPFKIYLALAAGKPVISQQGFSLPEGAPVPPMLCVPADPSSLASAIESLAQDRGSLASMSQRARTYYQQFLSSERIGSIWRDLLNE